MHLIPKTISASAYQEIMDCPYQFFASRCLKLKPPESIKELLEKSDYGERVHLCLQAFHSKVKGLAGPFDEPVSSLNLDRAIELLNTISEQVFAGDLDDNFLHHAWLRQWQQMIEPYLRWQIQQTEFKPDTMEQNISHKTHSLYDIRGRLDRVDRCDQQLRILDYKSGATAKKEEVLSGEKIQLPFYALLGEALSHIGKVEKVEYLSFASGKIKHDAYLQGEELQLLKQQVAQRLDQIMEAMHKGEELPAWGDDQSCRYCLMQSLCRKLN